MSQNRHANGIDPARSRLRATVEKLQQQLASLKATSTAAADGKGPHHDLLSSFEDLVHQLALGPEPEVRECPKCGGIGMRAATLCGSCWTRLTPPEPA